MRQLNHLSSGQGGMSQLFLASRTPPVCHGFIVIVAIVEVRHVTYTLISFIQFPLSSWLVNDIDDDRFMV